MFLAFLVVTVLTVLANVFSAGCDFARYDRVATAMTKAGVPLSWMTTLGVLKAAGAVGLVVGVFVPLIGTAAAIGLVLFFVGAILTHLRAHDRAIGLPAAFLLLAVATLALRLPMTLAAVGP